MTFSESLKTCFRLKYANFNGRASRSEYWWFHLAIALLYIVAFTPFLVMSDKIENGDPFFVVFAVAAIIAFLGCFLPSLAVTVRRMHDFNFSGWWYLVMFIPYLGGLLALGMMIAFCFRGNAGPNRFGEDPLEPEARRLAAQF